MRLSRKELARGRERVKGSRRRRRRGGQIGGLGRGARTLEGGGVLGEAVGVGYSGGARVRRLRRRRPRGRAVVVGWGRRCCCLCRRHGWVPRRPSSSSPLLGFGLD